MFRVKFDATLEQMLVALRESEIVGFYFIVCPRLAFLACARFRGRSLKEEAFKMPPFSLWTLWYATFGVLTVASFFTFLTVLPLILT